MKFLFDLFPVILFFAIFKWGEGNPAAAQSVVDKTLAGLMSGGTVAAAQAPIMLATAVAIVATFAQIGYLMAMRRKVDGMLWVSLAIITIFGGATIYFNSEDFIKWKPTVLYWCFGVALIGARLLFGKNLIRLMMEKQVSLPDPVWERLCQSWIVFLAVMGILNLYFAFWGNFATSTWVSFKVFGGMGLMLAFILGQSVYMSKHMKEAG